MAMRRSTRVRSYSKRDGTHVSEHTRDIDTGEAKRKLYAIYGNRVSNVRFGSVRADKTRGVKFEIDGQQASYSYLTDIV